MTDETVSFHVEKEKNNKTKEILKEVYSALEEKEMGEILCIKAAELFGYE